MPVAGHNLCAQVGVLCTLHSSDAQQALAVEQPALKAWPVQHPALLPVGTQLVLATSVATAVRQAAAASSVTTALGYMGSGAAVVQGQPARPVACAKRHMPLVPFVPAQMVLAGWPITLQQQCAASCQAHPWHQPYSTDAWTRPNYEQHQNTSTQLATFLQAHANSTARGMQGAGLAWLPRLPLHQASSSITAANTNAHSWQEQCLRSRQTDDTHIHQHGLVNKTQQDLTH